jgi:predicted regulator of Ras-like GTPase activity (Roadblock/LC7/MglB family)
MNGIEKEIEKILRDLRINTSSASVKLQYRNGERIYSYPQVSSPSMSDTASAAIAFMLGSAEVAKGLPVGDVVIEEKHAKTIIIGAGSKAVLAVEFLQEEYENISNEIKEKIKNAAKKIAATVK